MPDSAASGQARSGPRTFGAFLDPPRLCGLDLPGASESAVVDAAADLVSTVCWTAPVDGTAIFLTHAGGVFVEFPAEEASDDPVGRIQEQRLVAIDLMNLVICELALASDIPAMAFAISDLASATVAVDRTTVETWAAAGPYAPTAMYLEAQVRNRSPHVAGGPT